MLRSQVEIPEAQLAEFCSRWQITELSLFGSVLRADFRPDSDIDILVAFAPEAQWSLLDIEQMREELTGFLGRTVDFVSRRAVEQSTNQLRSAEILNSAETIYAA
jgi:predicted nucleotidyltransferase